MRIQNDWSTIGDFQRQRQCLHIICQDKLEFFTDKIANRCNHILTAPVILSECPDKQLTRLNGSTPDRATLRW
ncbi:hypothetical protein Ttaiw_01509 [Tepidimonas taiwanensis]|uniref:Uncharacterized protein n=1 Tax=Tepidimonas taiwanensis TaxID=307486 RepID=A0A554X670_9BURK|nr:hypothetical protein Ttaiw_01509 [Tepidimonas taiwanensis]